VEKPEGNEAPGNTSNRIKTTTHLPSNAQASEDQSLAMKKQNLNQRSEQSKPESESGSGRNPATNELDEQDAHKTSRGETISDPKQDGLIHRLP
jgi:hypothetical protein